MNREWFTSNRGCGTTTNFYRISKEDYARIKDKTGSELEKEIYPDGIPEDLVYGYGFYGCSVGCDSEGNGWVSITTGNSCD